MLESTICLSMSYIFPVLFKKELHNFCIDFFLLKAPGFSLGGRSTPTAGSDTKTTALAIR